MVINCEIYMEQPKGFEKYDTKGNNLVWKLRKSLYGLKQSGRNWNNMLNSFLLSENFKSSYVDQCVYIKNSENYKIIVIIWVDDIIIATNDKNELLKIKNSLKQSVV